MSHLTSLPRHIGTGDKVAFIGNWLDNEIKKTKEQNFLERCYKSLRRGAVWVEEASS